MSTVAGSITQTRAFTRDNRGFLTSESHPEINATVTHGSYDARGHAQRNFNGVYDLTFEYDRAERLVEIRRTSSGDVLKGYKYGTANSGTNRKLAKIVEQWRTQYNVSDQSTVEPLIFSDGFETGNFSRWSNTVPFGPFTEPPRSAGQIFEGNPEALIDAEVREAYEYRGKGGRPSKRTTNLSLAVNGSPVPTAEEFVQDWSYTDLGDVESMGYPACNFTFCTDDAPRPAPTISNAYARGELRRVTGYTGNISYHANSLIQFFAAH